MQDYNRNGAIPSPDDPRDWDIVSTGIATRVQVEDINYPESYMIPNLPEEIYNQDIYPTCVSFALALVKEVQDEKEQAPFDEKRCSTGFIYANRAEDDWQGDGMISREALKQLQKVGVCAWSDFPINKHYKEARQLLEAKENYKELREGAIQRSIKAYYRIYTLEELKYTLMYVGPVLASIPSYSSAYWNRTTGEMKQGPEGTKTGNHAVVFVGWKDNDTIIVRNSWGKNWGDGGYGYLKLSEYKINEMWAIADRLTLEIEIYQNCKAGNHESENWNRLDLNEPCVEKKYLERVCKHCGHVEWSKLIEENTQHSFGNWYVEKEPGTCAAGREARVCSVCQLKETRTIEATGHPFSEWIEIRKASTKKPARYKRECPNCGRLEYKNGEKKLTFWHKIIDFFKGLIQIFSH